MFGTNVIFSECTAFCLSTSQQADMRYIMFIKDMLHLYILMSLIFGINAYNDVEADLYLILGKHIGNYNESMFLLL